MSTTRCADHHDTPLNKLGRQFRKSVITAFCISTFNRDVPAIDVTCIGQTLREPIVRWCLASAM